jgi:hypothetical protein
MSEGKAASGPFHSDASRNLPGRRGRASNQQSPLALSPAPHTTPAERVSPSAIIPSAGLFRVGIGSAQDSDDLRPFDRHNQRLFRKARR